MLAILTPSLTAHLPYLFSISIHPQEFNCAHSFRSRLSLMRSLPLRNSLNSLDAHSIPYSNLFNLRSRDFTLIIVAHN